MAIENINGIADAVAPELEANLVKLPPEALVEGVTELDDGSAIIGEMEMESETPIAIPFDANLAEHIDEDVLSEISNAN
tara:strand:+ start:420 stop:656 length:237 start_codon:yes stop_codon:yes gene_type:complete